MAQNSTRPRRMAELDQSEPGQEEAAGSQRNVEIRRSAREIGRHKCEDQERQGSMAGTGGAQLSVDYG